MRGVKHILAVALCALLFAPVSVQGQLRLRNPEMYVGVHGGLLASTVTFSPNVSTMDKFIETCILGGNGGFVFRYSEQRCCAVQVELNYMQRGWREYQEGSDSIAEGSYTRKLHYLELPFLMHIYFGSQSWRGFVNLGPQVGYCISDDMGSGSLKDNTAHQHMSIDNRFDWGIAGGIGFYYRSRNAGVYQFETRFNYSFGTVFGSKTTDYFRKSNSMNLSFNVAWLWEIKKDKQRNNKSSNNQLEYGK